MLETAQEWLDQLVLTEFNRYRAIELYNQGHTRNGFAKISDDKKFMTLIFHDHKDKWSMSKEPISCSLLYSTKTIDKNIFDTIVNQNLSNL